MGGEREREGEGEEKKRNGSLTIVTSLKTDQNSQTRISFSNGIFDWEGVKM